MDYFRSAGLKGRTAVVAFILSVFLPVCIAFCAYAAEETPEYYLNVSLKLYQDGQYEKSIEAARQALRLRPDYDLAYNNICAAYNELQLWDLAVEAGEKAVALNPDNQLAKNNLAVSIRRSPKASSWWKNFWEVEYRTNHTINFINPPLLMNVSFLLPLYLLIAVMTIGISLYFRHRRSGTVFAAFLLSCAVGATIFAVRMDFSWFMWWKKDASAMGGKEIAARFNLLEAYDVYGYAAELKKLVPADAKLSLLAGDEPTRTRYNGRYSPGRQWVDELYLRSKIRYHLLPLRLYDEGNYIAVFRDPRIHYNLTDHTLKDDNNVIAHNVELLRDFGNDSFLFKTTGQGALR